MPAGHSVQFNKNGEGMQAAAEYLRKGFAAGEGGVIIAADARAAEIRARLRQDYADADGRLATLDLDRVLADAFRGGAFKDAAFARMVVPALEAACARSAKGRVRLYSEVVDALPAGARKHGAAVERWFGGLVAQGRASVRCAYALDLLDCTRKAFDAATLHERVAPAWTAALSRRVEEAVVSVLKDQADMVRSLVRDEPRYKSLTFGEAATLWLCHNMPRMASKVAALARARK